MFGQLCKSERVIVGPLDSSMVFGTAWKLLKVFLVLNPFRLCLLFFRPEVFEIASHYIQA